MVWVVETAVGAVLSAFLQVLFDRLASQSVIKYFIKEKFDVIVLERLKMVLLKINEVLNDADEKQFTSLLVKDWVDKVKDAAYRAEELLDQIAAKAASSNNQGNGTSTGKTSKCLKDGLGKMVSCMGLKDELEQMVSELEKLAEQRSVLSLKESLGRNSFPRSPSTSLVNKCKVFGIDGDIEKVIEFLISDKTNESEIPVIAITGMAGVGKTTLAQLLYNDLRVEKHFKRAWAYVSEEFDVFKVTKTIYDSFCSRNCNITDLDLIQLRLQQKLSGKKFLLVLDDVWNEDFFSWDLLQNSFIGAARGSRIIVTTRSQCVASTMHAAVIHPLQLLSDEHCWSVCKKYAFGSENFHVSPELEAIGKELVKKCKGLPLAVKLLGSLLHSKLEVNEWENILNNKLWDLQSDSILPSLRLSYYYLPANLKRCFSYCSIFPKGYIFEKEKLVLLWMAEGFLHQPRMEVGNEYFHELLSRSFFQPNKMGFVMHDLVNELAQIVSGQFAFNFESGNKFGTFEKTRHVAYIMDQNSTEVEFEALTEIKFLRTFLILSSSSNNSQPGHINESVVYGLLSMHRRRLRVLSLSNCSMAQFPDSCKKLTHLRYLDFSGTEIKVLPSFICSLYNLQTLKLSRCKKLVELPGKMGELTNLVCLDLNETKLLKEMPPGFGRLKNLQLLTTFVVSKHYKGSSISELGELLHLGGKLSILGLENIRNVADAKNAKLKKKKNIKELVFRWNNGHQLRDATVLENLHPHENIEKLSIEWYNGTKLPNWIGQLSSLKELHVRDCPNLERLAGYCPSWKLLRCLKLEFKFDDITYYSLYRNLQNLHIESSCDSLVIFKLNFFNRLETLQIHGCNNLKHIEVSDDELGCLQSLEIADCHNLELFAGRGLLTPNLTSFKVRNCNGLLSLPEQMHTLTSLQVLDVLSCPRLESFPIGGLPINIQSLLIKNCDLLTPKHEWRLNNMASLTCLTIIGGCRNLDSFPQQDLLLPASLTSLEISEFPELEVLNLSGFQPLNSLKTLEIKSCAKLERMSEGSLPINIQSLLIEKCDLLTPKYEWGLNNMTSLTRLTIIGGCRNLYSFPQQDLLLPASLTSLEISEFLELEVLNLSGFQPLNSLKTLEIKSCDKLKSMSGESLPSSISSLRISKCPLMTTRCRQGQGEDWPKVSHIRKIVINDIKIQ